MVLQVVDDNYDMQVTNTIYNSYFAVVICNMQVVDDIYYLIQN